MKWRAIAWHKRRTISHHIGGVCNGDCDHSLLRSHPDLSKTRRVKLYHYPSIWVIDIRTLKPLTSGPLLNDEPASQQPSSSRYHATGPKLPPHRLGPGRAWNCLWRYRYQPSLYAQDHLEHDSRRARKRF